VLLGTAFLSAQSAIVQLFDKSGESLIGAKVVVQISDVSTITNLDGKFSIPANTGNVLVMGLYQLRRAILSQ